MRLSRLLLTALSILVVITIMAITARAQALSGGARSSRRTSPTYSVAPDYRINRAFRLQASADLSEERIYADTRIIIHFYAPGSGSEDAVMSDTEWAAIVPGATGNAKKGDVPDFIEDLAVALTRVYDALLSVRHATDSVFEAVLPLKVYVRDLGGDPGESMLGGPMYISNRRFEARPHGAITLSAWEDLCLVAAHELVHVLQGRYYAGGRTGNLWNFIGPGNRWFIEATANYYASLACRPRDAVKHEFYLKDGFGRYLSSSLTTNSDQSYYTAGAFLEWLAATYSRTLVGDAWARGGTNDLDNLNAQLIAAGEPGGVSEAFGKYCRWMITNPEATDSMNYRIKMEAMSMRTNEWLTARNIPENFSARTAFIRIERSMEPLSAQYFNLYTRNRTDALFVIDPGIGSPRPADVEWITYDMIGNRRAHYTANKSLEDAVTPPGSRPGVIPHFGVGRTNSFEQWIVNRSMSEPRQVRTDYYLLNPPDALQQADGLVSWSTAGRLNIPSEVIAGYNVYADGRKLNARPVPVSPDRQEFRHAELKGASVVTIAVVDRHGNIWPEYAGISPAAPKIRPGDTIQFSACFSDPVNRKPVSVEWKVVTSGGGRITPGGLFTAPSRDGRYTVEVRNRNNPGQTARVVITVDGARPAPNALNELDFGVGTMYINIRIVTPTIENFVSATTPLHNVVNFTNWAEMTIDPTWTRVKRSGRDFQFDTTINNTAPGRARSTVKITVGGRFNSGHTRIDELTVTYDKVEHDGQKEEVKWNFTAAGIPMAPPERRPLFSPDDERKFSVICGNARERPAGFRFARGEYSMRNRTGGNDHRYDGFQPLKAAPVSIEIFFYRDSALAN